MRYRVNVYTNGLRLSEPFAKLAEAKSYASGFDARNGFHTEVIDTEGPRKRRTVDTEYQAQHWANDERAIAMWLATSLTQEAQP